MPNPHAAGCGIGALRYRAAGVKAIWQGGEKHELTGYSFVAQVDYAGAEEPTEPTPTAAQRT